MAARCSTTTQQIPADIRTSANHVCCSEKHDFNQRHSQPSIKIFTDQKQSCKQRHELIVRHGGSLVDSLPFIQRIVDSNPALAAMYGPRASPSLRVACGASA